MIDNISPKAEKHYKTKHGLATQLTCRAGELNLNWVGGELLVGFDLWEKSMERVNSGLR